MKYKDFENAFSAARLNKYKNACGGNTNKALTLYRHNVKLCQKFYGVLNIFEIILRNAINQHYTAHFNDVEIFSAGWSIPICKPIKATIPC